MSVTDPIYEDHEFAPDRRSAFGPIFSAFEVDHAVATCVRAWVRDYLAELARQRGLDPEALPAFRSIVDSSEARRYPEDQLPALLVASTGVESRGGRLELNGDGFYTARFRVDCGAVVSARGNRHAVRLARYYAAAVRALLLQQLAKPRWSGLEGVRRVDWVGERYQALDEASDRTQARGTTQLVVEVENVTNWAMGPDEPVFPEPTWLTDAETVEVVTVKEPISGGADATSGN
jgi:hypothetical protein